MNSVISFAAAACLVTMFLIQEPAPVKKYTEGKYPLEAILVLTPEQYSQELKKGREKFRVGELLCPAAESVVQQVFEKYTRVITSPEKGSPPGTIVLTFRIVDLEATMTVTAFGKRKMVLLAEWTATDESGKVFWVPVVSYMN